MTTRPAKAGLALFPYLLLSTTAHVFALLALKPGLVTESADASSSPILNVRILLRTPTESPAINHPESKDGEQSISRADDVSFRETSNEQPGNMLETSSDSANNRPPMQSDALEREAMKEGPLPIPDLDPLRYRTMAELDIPPYLRGELPEDPPELQTRLESGSLVLEVWIDETGVVTKAVAIKSNLPSVFSEASIAMLENARYVPAKQGGVNVRSRIMIELHFAPPPAAVPQPGGRPIGKGFR